MKPAPFVPYAGFVSDIQKTYAGDYLKAQHAMGVKVRHYKHWDKSDLMALHESFFGKEIFQHLVGLVTEAWKEEKVRLSAPSRKVYCFAQHDLTRLAPEGMDWKAYAAMIADAVASIRSLSFRVTRDLAQRFAEDAAEADNAYPAFDAQQALARMEAIHLSPEERGEDAAIA